MTIYLTPQLPPPLPVFLQGPPVDGKVDFFHFKVGGRDYLVGAEDNEAEQIEVRYR